MNIKEKIIARALEQEAMKRMIGITKPASVSETNTPSQEIVIKAFEGTPMQVHNAMMDKVEEVAETATGPVLSFMEKIRLKAKLAKQDPVGAEALEPEFVIKQTADVFEQNTFTGDIHDKQAANLDADDSTGTEFRAPEIAQNESNTVAEVSTVEKAESFALNITLNEKQLAAKEMAFAGKSFCLIGAAGTGKTTAQRAIAESLLLDSRLSVSNFKAYDRTTGARKYVSAPSIAFVAYTRRAASNLAKAILKSPVLAEQLQNNIMTIHSLLEYEPETYFATNEEGETVEKFRFAPMRTENYPLDITHLVIEESSMVGVSDLWPKLFAALPMGVQIIFIGDINQLPPVFGPSILNYALVQLPIIELTQGYRNQGVVLENAWNILEGKMVVETDNWQIIRGKKPVHTGQDTMSHQLGNLFKIMYDDIGEDGFRGYDPEDCIVLSPFNKQGLGTVTMNKYIAQFLGEMRGAVVHEVIAGFNKHYLAIGDKVMWNKVDMIIESIELNPQYYGKVAQTPGVDLTRFGHRNLGSHTGYDPFADSEKTDYSNFNLASMLEEKGERKQQASHIIHVVDAEGRQQKISNVGDLGEQVFTLGYVLSVHKSQGSEWRKVFIILHKDHATMLYRELFYTACTRARTDIVVIAKDVTIKKAIDQQRIKGQSLQDKLEFFNSGQLDKYSDICCVKG